MAHAYQPTTTKQVHGSFVVPSLDGLRALSILIVFVGHAGFPSLLSPGSGVTVFFFISGFLITTLLRREYDRHGHISLGRFYLRRVLRIFPPMYLGLAIALVLAVTGVLAEHFTWPAVGFMALHLTNYWTVFHGTDDLLYTVSTYWSLAVEEHFYLVFPLLLLVMLKARMSRRAIAATLAVIAVGILAWRCYLTVPFHAAAVYQRVYYATDTRADGILWGCVVALVLNPTMGDRLPLRRRTWLAVGMPVAVVVFYAAQLSDRFLWSVGFTVQTLAAAVFTLAVVSWPDTWVGRILNHRVMVFIGVLSYSMYIIHRIVIFLFTHALGWDKYVSFFPALAGTILYSYLSYRWMEEPLGRLRRRLSSAGEGVTLADREATSS